MSIATWIATGLLAAFNLFAGAGKAFTPWEQLSQKMPLAPSVGKTPMYLAAWAEIVGAVGLILPNVLAHTISGWEWAMWVSFAAAVGLTIVQVLAVRVHIVHKDNRSLPVNVVLIVTGVLAATLLASN
ncbi:hypothetical protein E1202_29840 [Saccharopolyspora karakumensis]|uniref:DoxX-like family protein n=1 Tax=Saccharopolyspora karakumensis TaxID=2530386 RepID=A0A4R5B851_9PSEU|nr:DoxX family protein [Saccharopolyspora karakumensis]TDD80900.1 hypothetical protein E1202_29840 [Saccharopolyspora karakumensis]